LDPVTGYLHLVYRGENGGVFYSYSTDNGSNWYPAECVGQGWFPCVVCENQGPNPVWVCYQTSIEGIECKARLEMGQWESFVVHSSEPLDAGAPSMALRYCGLPSEGPAVYVGYAVLDEASHTAVHCKAVSLFGGVGPLEIVESPTVGRYVHRPTLASTPGDIVHCAWEMLDPDEGVYRIQYKQRSTVGQWPQAAEDVSPWPVLPTEPASYPSVDAFGDRVYAVWRGMDLSVPPVSEAWRKERPLIGPPYDWTNPRNLSQSPGSESDYPQVSTPYAALLQEWRLFPTSNWDVWININGVPEHFFVSSDQSQYPDVAVVPPDPLHNYTD
jgi:hypothetical protein